MKIFRYYISVMHFALLPGCGVRLPLSSSSVVFCVYVYEVTVYVHAYHSRRFSLFVVGLLALANAGSEEDRMRPTLSRATEHMGADDLHTFFELLDINGNGKVSERDIRVAVDAAMVAEDAVESKQKRVQSN